MISMKPVDIPPSSQVHGAASEGCRTDTLQRRGEHCVVDRDSLFTDQVHDSIQACLGRSTHRPMWRDTYSL